MTCIYKVEFTKPVQYAAGSEQGQETHYQGDYSFTCMGIMILLGVALLELIIRYLVAS